MTMRLTMTAVCVAASTLAPAMALAQTATVAFRCGGASVCGTASSVDRVQADASALTYSGQISKAGVLTVDMRDGSGQEGRTLALDFTEYLSGVAGAPQSGLYRKATQLLTVVVTPVDASGNTLRNGLNGIATGNTARAAVLINVDVPGLANTFFEVRFNARFTSAQYLLVRRTGPKAWELDASAANASQDARVVRVDTSNPRKYVSTDAGLYRMPFSATVTTP